MTTANTTLVLNRPKKKISPPTSTTVRPPWLTQLAHVRPCKCDNYTWYHHRVHARAAYGSSFWVISRRASRHRRDRCRTRSVPLPPQGRGYLRIICSKGFLSCTCACVIYSWKLKGPTDGLSHFGEP